MRNAWIIAFWMLSIACICANSTASDIETSINQMIARQAVIVSGYDQEAGDFIIARVEFRESWGDDALAIARQEARGSVAKFFGVDVSGSTESTRESVTVGTTDSNTTTFRRSFRKVSKSEFDQCIKGLSLDRIANDDRSQFAIFILSESQIRHVASIAEAARNIGHTEDESGATLVKAIGIAVIRNGNREEARNRALSSAKREAIEKVMGMVVVGLTQSNNRLFSESVFSNTDGFIDSWDEITADTIGDYYKIEIKASIVPQKLYDNYSSHLQSMGDPTFAILSKDSEVRIKFAEYLSQLGLRIVSDPRVADWDVVIDADFDQIEDPTNPDRKRTVLAMSFEMRNRTTSDVIGPLSGPSRFSSRLSNPKRARTDALNKGFAKWKNKLHESINEEIVQMARNGRPFSLSIDCQIGDIERNKLQESLLSLPGVTSGELEFADQLITFDLKYVGKSDFLCEMVRESLYRILSEEQFDMLALSSQTTNSLIFKIQN